MIIFALAAVVSTVASADLGDASDRFEDCVIAKTDEFAAAKEAANVTIEAANAACILQRADLRGAIQTFVALNQGLSRESAKSVEQRTYDIVVNGTRDRALVRLMSARSKIVPRP